MKLFYRHSSPVRNDSTRRGTILILTVAMLLVTLGIAAFTVDFGVLNVTKGQIQNAADSAAHAASQELIKSLGPGATLSSQQATTAAGSKAQAMVARFRSGDVASTQLSVSRDVRFGRRYWNSTTNQWVSEWNTSPFNMVEVTVRRTEKSGAPLGSVFASVFGYKSFDVEAKSVAAVTPTTGYQLRDPNDTLELFPFTVDLTTWNAFVNANLLYNPNASGGDNGDAGDADDDDFNSSAQNGSGFLDQHSYSASGVSSGSDGVLEMNIYPDANTSTPAGNRGTVDLGSPNNSTDDLKRQIQYGLNAYDLSFFPNSKIQFDTDGALILNGDTGISAGIEDSLQTIVGQKRIMPIFTTVSGPGNNAQYTMVRFVGVRVMAVKLTGGPSQRYLRVQPCAISTRNTVRGATDVLVDGVYSQPVLIQ